ncbi:hypothetical protein GOL88_11775 [Sinorhizobium medicae]|uniref:hypothetical protein n=2 Tax=Sinorhizobium medicae TaxID=110321 RepID=UPI0012DFCAF5|nr:hypothetical protein [Sinorhizobium medicae]MDX0762223.1 hypothetical protein [Sinorhizobium medicae]MDX0823365.1 hypothetical protein [Sinorhizobium medicae]MDX1185710.1 hypothetical protein [Sinorhizobium medicae]
MGVSKQEARENVPDPSIQQISTDEDEAMHPRSRFIRAGKPFRLSWSPVMDEDALREGRRRRRALLAEIECSRDEFQQKWDARAELLGRRLSMFKLGLAHRQADPFWAETFGVKGVPYRYPPRRPDREEGWHDPKPLTLPPGNTFPWQDGDQSHEWKTTEAGTKPWTRRPFPWERPR